MLEANNAHPPMVLRVDLSRSSRPPTCASWQPPALTALEIQWAPAALSFEAPDGGRPPAGLRGGRVSVQDAGAQLAAPLLEARPGCACSMPARPRAVRPATCSSCSARAPISPARRHRRRRARAGEENLRRLGRTARLIEADMREPATFWDGRPFERILLDAPCSATGVIRRHPDIKLLRRPADIPAFAAAQLAILRAASRMLAPGGRMLYSTCSVLPEENEEVVAAFLGTSPDTRRQRLPPARLAPGRPRASGRGAAPAGSRGGDRRLLLCLSRKDNGRNLSHVPASRRVRPSYRCIHATRDHKATARRGPAAGGAAVALWSRTARPGPTRSMASSRCARRT